MSTTTHDNSDKLIRWDEEYDFIVLGAGAGGMTAALVSSIEGMSTLLIEKSGCVGGTSARSSGSVWIPDNPQLRALGVNDDAEKALQYMDALVGDKADRIFRETYVTAGPKMIEYLEKNSDVVFQVYRNHPDYRQELPGAAKGGRPLEPLPFDGRILGENFKHIAWPLPELMLFGRMMITRGEAARLMKLIRLSPDGFALGLKLVIRYLADRLSYERGTRLVLGNALIARLYKNLLDNNVTIWLKGNTTKILTEQNKVSGLLVEHNGKQLKVRAKHGILLAGGGFPSSPEMREKYLPKPVAEYTSAYEWCTGGTLQLAGEVGAALGPPNESNAFWFPGSVAKRKDGTTAVYPHIVLDRSKPGLVAVNSSGRRFVNEAVSYHEFTKAMYRSHRNIPSIPTMLICDRRFLWKYGLGMIRPYTPFIQRFIDTGYLYSADSVEELAVKIGVNTVGLAETVRSNNESAQTGIDAEFHKGDNAYDCGNGDMEHRPNPCIGPIDKPPFYAVAVYPTPLGTSLGLQANASAQVLDASGQPIAGLYVCGNDMHSIMGGEYQGAGAQLGGAMIFGYLAAKNAAGKE
jgi:3-oxosteroid 1-dehydrogenase